MTLHTVIPGCLGICLVGVAALGILAALLPLFIGALSRGNDARLFTMVGVLSVAGASLSGYAAWRVAELARGRSASMLLIAVLLVAPATILSLLFRKIAQHPPGRPGRVTLNEDVRYP
jgi:hypothetical protein